jgi:acyl-CoA synthetase (AMP-forming)/AMP-acid ligase II
VILESIYPAVDVPDVSLTEFVLGRADARGAKVAVVDAATGHSLTYGELADLVRGFAAGLAGRGIGKGDVVALLLPNSPLFPVVFHGALAAGATPTTLNPAYGPEEVAQQVRDARARLLITASRVDSSLRQLGVEIVLVDAAETPRVALAGLLGNGSAFEPEPVDPTADVAALPYSSGTTGLPKGVMLTHRNLVANLRQLGAAQQVTEDQVVLAVLPFFHIYGLQTIMNQALLGGATLVSMSRFRLEPFVEAIARHRISRIYAVPPMIVALAKEPGLPAEAFASVQHVLSAAAPLDPEQALICEARVGCPIKQGYGLTETGPATHLTPDDVDLDPASVGFALPSTECLVVDIDSGAPVAPGEAGELLIRGPQVMRGYLDNPAATAAMIGTDGFLHTGDLARFDERGQCFIIDRLKELIKVKGFQVAPAELEAVLLAHDAVADAAVVGYIDASREEVPKAFVVLRQEAEPEAILRFVAERVATYKRPALLEVVDEIPKSPSGKILRRLLRERAGGEAVRAG